MDWPKAIAEEVRAQLEVWVRLRAEYQDDSTPNTDARIVFLTAARLCDHSTATSMKCPLCGYTWTGSW